LGQTFSYFIILFMYSEHVSIYMHFQCQIYILMYKFNYHIIVVNKERVQRHMREIETILFVPLTYIETKDQLEGAGQNRTGHDIKRQITGY
jgi:hypothetical protein